MSETRIPLGQTISTRNSTLARDALSYNCFAEKEADGREFAVRRFGISSFRQLTAGTGSGLFAFGAHDVAVVGTTCYLDGSSIGTVVAGDYQFVLVNAGAGFFMKNTTNAYYYDGATLVAIVDADYPALTVWGVSYIDGYVCVMTPEGRIYNCDVNVCTAWSALSYISANASPGAAVAITTHLNLVVAFVGNGTEFFYDAANATGSPLLPVPNATTKVGCFAGPAIASSDNTILWVGQTAQRGRSVYLYDGLVPVPVSDQYIDRLLNSATSTAGVSAFFIKIVGHAFYVLTIQSANITLVMDLLTRKWHAWSTSSIGTPFAISSRVTTDGVTVITTTVAHGLMNGAVLFINGGGLDFTLLGIVVPRITGPTTFEWDVSNVASNALLGLVFISDTAVPLTFVGTGAISWTGSTTPVDPTAPFSATPYNQNYFSSLYYANTGTRDILLDQTTGAIYAINEESTDDLGVFIYNLIRTNGIDYGNNLEKFYASVEVISDKSPERAFVSYSDDDYTTYGYFRPVSLLSARSRLTRCGRARRRSWSLLYVGQSAVRFYALEPDVRQGL